MKVYIIIILLFIPFCGISQTKKPIDGFLGIKFRSNIDSAKAVIETKGGILKDSKSDHMYFEDVTIAGRSASLYIWTLNDKVIQGDFYFSPSNGSLFDFYNSLVSDMTLAYGKGKVTKEYKNDFAFVWKGRELQAIKSGIADYNTSWTASDRTKNVIVIAIEKNLLARLTYMDSELSDEYNAKKKSDL